MKFLRRWSRDIIILLILLTAASGQTYIAVLEFTGKNVSAVEASALTDRLRSEMFRTSQFRVIEREMMDEILSEQGFQMSGCTSDECMVEMGRLIGVDQIISGSVSRVGDVFSIAARIVSVQTAEIIRIATYDHEGKIGELLKTGMAQVARELAAGEAAPPAIESVTPAPIVAVTELDQTTERTVLPESQPPLKTARDEKPRFSIIGGFGVSVPRYSTETGYNYFVGGSVYLGAAVDYSIGWLHFRPELVYIERGHSWEPSDYVGDNLNLVTKIKGLSLNLIYPWRLGDFNLLLGLAGNFIISGTVLDADYDEVYSIGEDRDLWMADNLSAVEASFVLGVEYRLDQFLVGVRWVNDLGAVYEERWDYTADLNYFAGLFTVGYQF
ncbi:MAG: CsgG/HfaB family protein [Candidatus Neomarinimicrobiota bacterium]